MGGPSREEKTPSTLIEEAESAIERARSLRARTDLNLAWSEFLLNIMQEQSWPTLQNNLLTRGSNTTTSQRNAIQNIAILRGVELCR